MWIKAYRGDEQVLVLIGHEIKGALSKQRYLHIFKIYY